MVRPYSRMTCLWLTTLLAVGCDSSLSPAPQRSQTSSAITAVSPYVERKDDSLWLRGAPFYFAGANQYYLFYKDRKMVDEVFSSAKALGLTVMRTWAFCDGVPHEGYCFQPQAGVYDENTFRQLDYVVATASQMGIKLILALGNNWGGYNHFGGIDQYLSWVDGNLTHDDFYRDPRIKTIYRNYVAHVLDRINTITHVAYKDDPTIAMWELINEPRADDKQSLYAWIDEMAGFIKSIDSHHLVSTGSEGAFVSDFYETHKSANIDVASLHLYPELWRIPVGAGQGYLREHIRIAKEKLKKPFYVGEFGVNASFSGRPDVYRQWYNTLNQGGASGALFWTLGGRQYGDPQTEGSLYPDYDGFTIYYPDSKQMCPIIQSYASAMATKLEQTSPMTKAP